MKISRALANIASTLRPARYHVFREPLPYEIGLKLQHDIVDYKLASRDSDRPGQDVILFLEHTPTYTTGRRDNTPDPDVVHPEEKKVQNVGADFFITKRGGQVTYHGPGQLVGYPILDLEAMKISTRCYVEYMQRLLAGYCSDAGIEGILAPHPDGHVGVFASPSEKIASIGIHLRHRISSHGFAINITPDPVKWFDLVIACGLTDVRATSLQDLLQRSGKSQIPTSNSQAVAQAALDMVPRFERSYGRELVPLSEAGGDANIQRLIGKAEGEAAQANLRKSWPSEPRKQ